MDVIGEFRKIEKDGKLFELVYHYPKYDPISVPEGLFQPVFLCPIERYHRNYDFSNFDDNIWPDTRPDIVPVSFPPVYIYSRTENRDHSILPLFWCNNKEFDFESDRCSMCNFSDVDTNYYFCKGCNEKYHKECVESQSQIRHPYHCEHSLQLIYQFNTSRYEECICCGKKVTFMVYQCTICDIFMHTVCAMKSILFVVNQSKRHDHPLIFFPRQTSLTCNVCGLLRKSNPTYICAECNFVAHNDCMYSPNIIKISRHNHRISYTFYLPSGEWSCGVCHQSIDCDYGGYTCNKCGDYFVHSRCALRKDVCDGVELEGVPAEDDITQDVQPFEMISEGVIRHFLHDHHHLQLKDNISYDENKICQGCVLPIFEGDIYSCMECDFILHETCAKAHRIKQHALHPHPLTLYHIGEYYGTYKCNGCYRDYSGFTYGCHMGQECNFDLDINCAFIYEPFHYIYHEHPLFIASNPKETFICQLCQTKCDVRLYCIKCNFILCMKCATLPEKVRYNCDQHFLKIIYGEEVSKKDWCEVCERDLEDTNTKMLYKCNECCTAIHIKCLFGEDLYMKVGQIRRSFGKVQVHGKRNITRPLCHYCKNRCQGKILKKDNLIACCMKCAFKIFK